MWSYNYNVQNELYHYGVLGMKWGHRKSDYRSTSLRARSAKRQNQKVDEGFKNWKTNAQKREDAITLGKKANTARFAYEKDKKNKSLKKDYKQATKEYKKALKGNTTYRKGQVRKEVGSDISRKYLSEAKSVKKQLNKDPNNKDLKKQYNKYMSQHDIERAKARKAPMVAQKRSTKKATMKRKATLTVKAAATTAAVAGGAYVASRYMKSRGINVSINSQQVQKAVDAYKKFKRVFGYVY